ncbi:hypothetical protein EVA_07523 [gut metagenome]|uniref:Uncharacterized protein n=1 Tax=gut metagenome TaxID=749906 RepID=J9GPM9_9ZZZZ
MVVQLVCSHSAGIQRISEPAGVIYHQIYFVDFILYHYAGSFRRISLTVFFCYFIDIHRKFIMIRAVQFSQKTSFILTESRVCKASDIAGASF